jgi:hypothetical protein
VDEGLNCHHVSVMNDWGYETLQRILKEFEGKKVRITIIEIED